MRMRGKRKSRRKNCVEGRRTTTITLTAATTTTRENNSNSKRKEKISMLAVRD